MVAPENKPSQNGIPPAVAPNPEVKPKLTRRMLTAQQKLEILVQTDGLNQGEIGAFLRRNGLYWSHLSKWRKLREEGHLTSLKPKHRGRPPALPETKRLFELEQENLRLRGKLERAEKIIDVQKKLYELFGLAPAKKDELD